MSIDRRQFQQQVASAAVALGSAGLLNPTPLFAEPQSMAERPAEIVDTHQHLWNLQQFELPWLAVAPKILARNYLPSDYAAATAGLNVVKSVYMEVDVAPRQQTEEANYVLGLCAANDNPMVGAVISGRPADHESFARHIAQFQGDARIKGVRQVLHPDTTRRGLCLEPGFTQSARLLGELGMSFDLCMRPGELADGAKLVDKCPDTRFILDHCGNADPAAFLTSAARGDAAPRHDAEAWKKDIAALAERKNVICKISGIVAGAPEKWDAALLAPPINHCLDTFGPDRVVFGGDWPVCLLRASYRQWVEALLAIISNRPALEQRKLLSGNATREYGL